MSKIKNKKCSAPKGTGTYWNSYSQGRIQRKKISERIFLDISYDINFIKATYAGKTQRPAKITSLEKGIVGILLIDETSSFEK